jgi:hypothetical protein
MRSNEVNEAKKIWLRWVIDFCNTDLQKIDGEEKFYLTNVLDNLFSRFHSPEDIRKSLFEARHTNQFPFQIPNEIWEKVSSIQEGFKIFLDRIIKDTEEIEKLKRDEKTELPPYLKSSYASGATFTPSFHVFSDGSSEVEYIPIIYSEDIQDEFFKKNVEQNWTSLKADNFYSTHVSFRQWAYLRENDYNAWLYSKLDGAIKWVRKCKGCDRFFLNPTEREKLYCNSSCAARSIAKDKREKLRKNDTKYKAYLKKQRKYMKKRYIKMRQDQFGPNVQVGTKIRKRTV